MQVSVIMTVVRNNTITVKRRFKMTNKVRTFSGNAERVVVLPVTKERSTIDVSDFTNEILETLFQYGLQEKITDSAAIAKKTEPDEIKRKALRLEKVEECIKNLKSGKWNATRMDPLDRAIFVVASKNEPSVKDATPEQKEKIITRIKAEDTEASKHIMNLAREKMEADRKAATVTSYSSLLEELNIKDF